MNLSKQFIKNHCNFCPKKGSGCSHGAESGLSLDIDFCKMKVTVVPWSLNYIELKFNLPILCICERLGSIKVYVQFKLNVTGIT